MLKQIIVLSILILGLFSCSSSASSASLQAQNQTKKLSSDPELDQLLKAARTANSADAYQKLAQYYAKKKNVSSAMSSYQKALKLDSARNDIRMEYGGYSYYNNNKNIGLQEFKTILIGNEATKYMDEIASYLFEYQITQITNGPHNSAYPSWSSDGSSIYFQTDINGNWDIAKMSTSGANIQYLINSPANECHPSISNDDRFIAYTTDIFDTRSIYNEQKWREIMVYDIRNKISDRTTRNYLDDFYPRFNRHNMEMTYITEEVNAKKINYGERFTYLFTMEQNGAFQIPAVKKGDYFINSGVKWQNEDKEEEVIYSSKENKKNYSLYKRNLKRSKAEPLLESGFNLISVDVSKDGKHILFTTDQFASLDLMMTDRYASRIERLTSYANDEDQAVFSPDGQKIAFHSNKGGQYDIYIIDLNSRSVEVTVGNLLDKINSDLL